MLDGDESYRGESCASFEFSLPVKQKPIAILRTTSVNNAVQKQSKPRSLEKRTRNDSDSVLECNKLSSNCKRSPSFREAEEIRELLKDEELRKTFGSDKSNKKDGCSQTDRKDVRRLRTSPLNSKPNNIEVSSESTISAVEPFEKEIRKLLDDQNLLRNVPMKPEPVQGRNKDLALEPLVRYAPSNNNNNHQVGLAAIQALALGLRLNSSGGMTLRCLSPIGKGGGSKEGSLKRAQSPGPSEPHKQLKVSPLDRYIEHLTLITCSYHQWTRSSYLFE